MEGITRELTLFLFYFYLMFLLLPEFSWITFDDAVLVRYLGVSVNLRVGFERGGGMFDGLFNW